MAGRSRDHLSELCSYFVLISSVIVIFLAHTCVSEPCVKVNACKCQTSQGYIDLSPLDNGQQPKFIIPGLGSTYYFNPCTPFSIGTCQNDAVCQLNDKIYYDVGKQDTASFTGEPGNIELTFTTGTPSAARTAHIKLVCSGEEGTFTAQPESPALNYNFELRSKYACLTQPGLSAGSILIILAFVFVLVYLVVGILFLKFARGAAGKELIPNYEFWADFPYLVKDGTQFVFRGCKAEETYERI